MKIQNTQTNVGFGTQYAVYRKGVERGLKPLGMPTRAARQAVGALIQPIATIEGDGLFVFSRSRLSPDQKAVTLLGQHLERQGGKAASASGSPVEITLPRNAEPETVKQTVLNYLARK